MSDPQPQRIFVGMSRLEIENCAPLGPARNIVVYTEAGHAYRFKVLQFRAENDGMVEVYDLSDKAEELAEPRGFDYPFGAPLTDEEAAELEQRLREELSKPHAYEVLPPSPPYTPKAGEIITVGGTECTVNHVVHTADKLEIAATRLHAALAQPTGSAVLIDIPARDGAE